VEAKERSKLHAIADPNQAKLRAVSTPTGQVLANQRGDPGYLWAVAISLDSFATGPCVRTGLRWIPDYGQTGSYDPGQLEAVEQLGLRLESRKMPYEMLAIDHVEKTPTEK
jgi:hypothetical protein